MSDLGRVVDLFGRDQHVNCWPWEHARFCVEDENFRTEVTSDHVTIRGTLSGGREEVHAIGTISGKLLRISGYQRGYLIDAVRDVVKDIAERIASRPNYTPPPKGWRKFGRTGR